VLSAVRPGAPPMEEEIFGPILPVVPVASMQEALAQIRSRPKPLALYVFAGNDAVVEQVLRGTSAGGSCVNNAVVHLANPELPFGGVGHSGMGSYHGVHGFRAFSHQRAVLTQQLATPVKLLYPPYDRKLRDFAGAAVKLLEK
jgi:aldehyde dehydrogenase (NAD+)